jgi:hypothetical protein
MHNMITEQTNSENPSLHWKYINCKGRISLDLGCGRWETVEYRDPNWPTTPEYLIQQGATEVRAFDIDPAEIDWYTTNITPKMAVFPECMAVRTVEDIRSIMKKYAPKAIKCDIEGAEQVFLELSDEEFCSIDHYALETHSTAIYDAFVQRFNDLNYEIIAVIDLVHAPPMKAIFAEKKR